MVGSIALLSQRPKAKPVMTETQNKAAPMLAATGGFLLPAAKASSTPVKTLKFDTFLNEINRLRMFAIGWTKGCKKIAAGQFMRA